MAYETKFAKGELIIVHVRTRQIMILFDFSFIDQFSLF